MRSKELGLEESFIVVPDGEVKYFENPNIKKIENSALSKIKKVD